jgi:SAM-dependent methyltransferase
VGYGDLAAAAARELARALRTAGIRDGLIVDLGCGSGTLARELTSRGYDVLGIDASADMIALAREVAPRARFVHGSIEEVDLPPCRAVFAIGESLSYLPSRTRRPKSLRALCARVARALQPPGLFAFDVITGRAPRMDYRAWKADTDWAVLTEVREDPRGRVVRRDITTFRENAGTWRRARERHAVGVYDRREVLRWLGDAGFRAGVARSYGRAPLPPRRLAFLARPRRRDRGTADP